MKNVKTIIVFIMALIMLQNNLNAKSNYTNIAGAIVATTAIVSLLSAQNECEYETYKNYIFDKKMVTTPAQPIIDYKFNICKLKQMKLIKNIDSVKGKFQIIKNKSSIINQISEVKDIIIAQTFVSSIDMLSGKKQEDLYIKIDKNGKLISYDERITTIKKSDLNTIFFTPVTKIQLTKKTYSEEIIYSGIIGNEIHLTYREYQSNLIRDSFTQNLVFDLSKGNIITIKSYKMEILEADNNKIVYKIID